MKHTPFLRITTMVFVIATGGTGIAGVWWSYAQEKPPTAQQVLERFIQVTGGKPAYEKIQTEIITGTVEFVEAGVKGTTIEYRAVPNRVYRAVELTGVGKIEAGTDGSVVWERSTETGPRVKTGEEGAAALREAIFNASIRWRDLYTKVELEGIENIDNQPCYKIVLSPKEGKPVTHCYDEKSGLLVKIEVSSLTPTLGTVPTVTLLGDYRIVEGIRIPHLVKRQVLANQIVTRIESVRFNVEIPKDRFALPADVQALLPKK